MGQSLRFGWVSLCLVMACGDGGGSGTPPATDAGGGEGGTAGDAGGATGGTGGATGGTPGGTGGIGGAAGQGGAGGTPPPECTEGNPICEPDCGVDSFCQFSNGACGCVPICPNPSVCNPGCGADEVCNLTCACEPRGCQADAPVCDPPCGPMQLCGAACECEDVVPPGPGLPRPSRSTAVDISADDRIVAMVNTDGASVSFFNVALPDGEFLINRVAVPAEPTSVVMHPDGDRAFTNSRSEGLVTRLGNIRAGAQAAGQSDIGGEPVGLALSPSGARLYVTDWTGGAVVVIDTETMATVARIQVGGNPYAIAITNDGDADDTDEQALVTQFYGRATGPEGTDDGKIGVVQTVSLATNTLTGEISLAPMPGCFNADIGAPPANVVSSCFPNQLYGITIHRAFGRTLAYVVSVAAQPQAPVNFNLNVQALISVIDIEAGEEDVTLTRNLNLLIKEQQVDMDGDENIGRRFLNTPNAIAFVNRDDVAIGYVSSAASDVLLRVSYGQDGTVTVGSPSAFNIVVGQNPQGVVTKTGGESRDAFVANLISRNLSMVSFRDQAQTRVVEATAQPAVGAPDFARWKGKRFFNTSTGLWSKEGWGSCQGCHPFGTTDNVTWSFPAGPRQTVSMDGQFASNDPTDMRALNWTAIFDEVHDFENNIRGVSGGKGAIQNAAGDAIRSAMGPTFSAITVEDGATTENHQNLNGSLKFVTNNPQICGNPMTCPDWDQVEAYVQNIRSPRGLTSGVGDRNSGRAVFEDGGCAKCHAGAKWTISRTFYDPAAHAGDAPGMRTFAANAAAATAMNPADLAGLPMSVNVDATLVAGDDNAAGMPAIKRMACNLRDVGTFDVDQVRANGQPAQGVRGFNPPSLLGVVTGAPYLHDGSAATLEELFQDHPEHTTAGNPNFVPSALDRADLAAFLLSIDESTETFAIPPNSELCPAMFQP